MKITLEISGSLSKQAFGAKIERSVLRVPREMIDAANQGDGISVEALLSCLHTFPSSFCRAFCWDAEDFTQNKLALIHLLKGYVDAEFLIPSDPPPQYATGAIPPSDTKCPIGYIVPDRDPR